MRYGQEDSQSTQKQTPEKKDSSSTKKISKKIGEYVDYEEVDRKKS
jgi:hypothetical protein